MLTTVQGSEEENKWKIVVLTAPPHIIPEHLDSRPNTSLQTRGSNLNMNMYEKKEYRKF